MQTAETLLIVGRKGPPHEISCPNAMLRDNFSAEERAEMVVDGEIEVICEFCSADYHFKLHEFDETKH